MITRLDPVHPAVGPPPDDIGAGHPMRELTEAIAQHETVWDSQMSRQVGSFFDSLAPNWTAGSKSRSYDALADALERGGPHFDEPVVEVGAGTGAGTTILRDHFPNVIAGDLSEEMIRRLPAELALRVRLDASHLPFPDRSVETLVCVNMFLFPQEVRRVLPSGGALIWINSLGERTPIHLSAERLFEVLGGDFDIVTSTAGWASWTVARRQ